MPSRRTATLCTSRPEVRLHVVRDLVEGLPTPQIAATPDGLPAHWYTLPIDARPAGRGICVVDVAGTATPFSAAFHAGTHCRYVGLHQRAAHRHLQPFEEIAHKEDSVSVAFCDAPTRIVLRHRDAISERVQEALQDMRDIAGHISLLGGHVPVSVHWPGRLPVELHIQKHWTEQMMRPVVSHALAPLVHP